ncbi:MAG: DUF429 domain-containing protein [Anaerolineales bacterium]|nr:DUF429 domain-containing protein [Chloroflexota bacterium]MBL6981071.1 DUF429 domain-containing protein [Anaerolineales bacterium]
MNFEQTSFIGIAPTAGKRDISYASIDRELNLASVEVGDLDAVIDFVSGHKNAFVAICGPRLPNQGLMKRDEYRATLNPEPHKGRWVEYRVADYLLQIRKISMPRTPAKVEDCSSAMQNSITLFQQLAEMGFQLFSESQVQRQAMEVNSYAAYAILLECLPYPKTSLEGRLQRQLKLYDLGLEISDPMRVFEEITRYKIIQGVLSLEGLYSAYELDALVAAYTAWTAGEHPERISMIGDPQEGQIVLPVKVLKTTYQ